MRLKCRPRAFHSPCIGSGDPSLTALGGGLWFACFSLISWRIPSQTGLTFAPARLCCLHHTYVNMELQVATIIFKRMRLVILFGHESRTWTGNTGNPRFCRFCSIPMQMWFVCRRLTVLLICRLPSEHAVFRAAFVKRPGRRSRMAVLSFGVRGLWGL